VNAIVVGLVVFACTFGGALLGMWLRKVLPAHHLESESKDTVKVGVGLVATMTALVLGLITSSAKNSFDAVDTAVRQSATQVLALDRALARYGPETGETRKGLQRAVRARIDMIWPQDSSKPADLDPTRAGTMFRTEGLGNAIRGLTPKDDLQRTFQARAVDLAEALLEARWIVFAGTGARIPVPFLAVLLFWLAITFASFGLFAPRNATVVTALFVCALSVGSAVFLVVEMDGPFDGLVKVSADPLRHALSHLDE